jgi:hypothetical protein
VTRTTITYPQFGALVFGVIALGAVVGWVLPDDVLTGALVVAIALSLGMGARKWKRREPHPGDSVRFTVSGGDYADLRRQAGEVLADFGGEWVWSLTATPLARAKGTARVVAWEAEVDAYETDDEGAK